MLVRLHQIDALFLQRQELVELGGAVLVLCHLSLERTSGATAAPPA
jgi:hypothetical protein